MLDLFSKKIGKKIDDNNIWFYDCTHSPLLYTETKGTEIDIVARISGKHKPIMMIEVKASIGESLQDSQKTDGQYQKTSEKHKIPLVYIIPKNYVYKKDIPSSAKKIYWEDILETVGKLPSISLETQISRFVEISERQGIISKEEKKLFLNKELLSKIYRLKEDALGIMNDILSKNKIKLHKEESQWGVGFYYTRLKANYFIGFNPYYKEEKDKNFFALAIEETCKNIDLGDRSKKPLYYADGYYFVPILDNNAVDGDKKILTEIRKKIEELKNDLQDAKIKENFGLFFSLREKIGEKQFDSLFTKNEEINESKYKKAKEKYIK